MCDDSSIFENSNKRHPCEWRRRVNGGGCKVGWQGVALCMCEPAAPTTTHNRCVYENSKTQNLLTLTARCVCVCAKRRRDACTTQWFHLGREKSAHTHTHYTTDPGKPQLFAHFCVMPTHAHTHTQPTFHGVLLSSPLPIASPPGWQGPFVQGLGTKNVTFRRGTRMRRPRSPCTQINAFRSAYV